MSSNLSKPDIYETVTSALFAALEEGAGEYVMPWHALSSPVNAGSRKPYHGINILLLWAAAQKKNYSSNDWGTYRQWSELGGQVRKGEHSTTIVFWKFLDTNQATDDEVQEEPKDSSRSRCMARAYHVFNAAQVDGILINHEGALPESERIAQAEEFFRALPGTVRFGGDQAYYSPTQDIICMPPFAQFKSAKGYYSVLSHEYAHFTGAPLRLNRDLAGRFGDQNRAMEELIAEIAAAMLCAHLHLAMEPRVDHAPYLASWLQMLRNNNRAIFTAASKAQEAVTYLQQLAGLPGARAS
jgi:antirestriction protein ArdC